MIFPVLQQNDCFAVRNINADGEKVALIIAFHYALMRSSIFFVKQIDYSDKKTL